MPLIDFLIREAQSPCDNWTPLPQELIKNFPVCVRIENAVLIESGEEIIDLVSVSIERENGG